MHFPNEPTISPEGLAMRHDDIVAETHSKLSELKATYDSLPVTSQEAQEQVKSQARSVVNKAYSDYAHAAARSTAPGETVAGHLRGFDFDSVTEDWL